MAKNSGALAHLTAHYNDSDTESDDLTPRDGETAEEDDGTPRPDGIKNKHALHLIDSRIESKSNSPANMLGLSVDSLATNDNRIIDDDMFEGEMVMDYNNGNGTNNFEGEDHDKNPKEEQPRPTSPLSFHRSLIGKPLDEIEIPREPTGRPSAALVEKINRLHEKMRRGQDMKASIEKRKDFRNPSIYEKLIVYCDIDELGTNYPPEIYDPHAWGPEAFYDQLAKRQKEEIDKKERERKERTKVEFVTGTAKKSYSSSENSEMRKKTKWDDPSSSSSLSSSKVGTLISGLNTRPLANTAISSAQLGAQTKPPVYTIKATK